MAGGKMGRLGCVGGVEGVRGRRGGLPWLRTPSPWSARGESRLCLARVQLLRTVNTSRDSRQKRDAIKKVIAHMTLGIDVSPLFTDMILVRAAGIRSEGAVRRGVEWTVGRWGGDMWRWVVCIGRGEADGFGCT